jgi:hypothetical protein
LPNPENASDKSIMWDQVFKLIVLHNELKADEEVKFILHLQRSVPHDPVWISN